MDYINFYTTLPPKIYIKLESESHKTRMTKSEIIIQALMCSLFADNKAFAPKKNAGFNNFYN